MLHRSSSYVEQIVQPLRDYGILTGKRGPGGGYVLGEMFYSTTFLGLLNVMRDGEPLRDNTGFNRALRMLISDKLLEDIFLELETR